MLRVHDIRETKVFQEAIEEGMEKERQRNLQDKLQSVSKWAACKVPAERIAEILALDIDLVRAEMAKNQP